jgi:membrane protease YdiL (CAAX protease family)
MSIRQRSIDPGAAQSSGYLAAVCLFLGCLTLLLRPPATLAAVVMTGTAGLLGALGPVPAPRDQVPWFRWIAVAALGLAAFALARARTGAPPVVLTAGGVAATVLAAVAEELFFRRLMFGWISRWGQPAAIGVTAVAFALVHLPAYGVSVLPVNLAAGILLGWQRWASGGWSAPAITHIAANLLQLG